MIWLPVEEIQVINREIIRINNLMGLLEFIIASKYLQGKISKILQNLFLKDSKIRGKACYVSGFKNSALLQRCQFIHYLISRPNALLIETVQARCLCVYTLMRLC